MKAPKKPSINSVRERKFSLAVNDCRLKPNAATAWMLDTKSFSLGSNSVFRYRPDILGAKEYRRCVSLIETRLPDIYNETRVMSAIFKLSQKNISLANSIFVKEMKHRVSLQQIAVDTIREMFDIPEHITILPNLTDGLSETEDQDDSPEAILSLSPERQREMRKEIEKRVILNGLVHGCAMHIWKSAHYIVKEEVDAIDPVLMPLYNSYTASVGWMMWQMTPDMALTEISGHGLAQGKNELKFEEEGEAECDIQCDAINFPVLLHEVAKGAMDYLICHAIPEDYTEEELTYYYSKADAYENEFWHYLLSPTLWTSLIEAANINTQEIPMVISRLAKLSYEDLSTVMKSCIDGAEDGKEKLKEFKIL